MHLTVEIDYDEDQNEDVLGLANLYADTCIDVEPTLRVKVYGPLAGRIDLIAERFSEDIS